MNQLRFVLLPPDVTDVAAKTLGLKGMTRTILAPSPRRIHNEFLEDPKRPKPPKPRTGQPLLGASTGMFQAPPEPSSTGTF